MKNNYRQTSLPVRASRTQTGIGKIPKDWKVRNLSDVAEYINGYGFSPKEWKSSGLPIIRIQNLNDKETEFNYYRGSIDDKYKVNDGDLLFSWSGSLGVYKWDRGEALLNQHIFKVIPKDTNKNFLYYILHLAIDNLQKRVHGSTMKHFKRSELKIVKIPLPPLAEQQKIVEILSSVDEGIQKVGEAIKKTERLKKGLMQKLFTEGIGHKEFKKTKIGRIPKEWEVRMMYEVVDINKESINPKKNPNSEFLYIDIDSIENGVGIIRKVSKILGEKAPSRARRIVRHNDIIMSTVRPYLKAFAIVPKKFDGQLCSTGFAVLTCQRLISPFYLLSYLFSIQVINQCKRMMIGGQYPALNDSQVKKIKIPLPPLPEQEEIAEILLSIDRKLRLQKERKEKLERIKKSLMQDLLTGRKRVKV